MIANEFIEELTNACQYFDWSYGRVHHKIRGKLRSGGQAGMAFDPIRAVCYVKTGLIFSENEWIDASEAIGLSLMVSGDLIAAANNVEGTSEYGSRIPSLREKIVHALMLKPETDAVAFSMAPMLAALIANLTIKNSHWGANID